MLRALAHGSSPLIARPDSHTHCKVELSDDIRGERLRFVEAMKEATTINVQSTFTSFIQGEVSSDIMRLLSSRRGVQEGTYAGSHAYDPGS